VNLVVNALQAMPGQGRLTAKTRAGETAVRLSVQDTGTGMTQDVIEKLFVPFFTTKDVGEGTGLGLPVVHGIVTSHGGTIRVRSTVGQGSTFEIELPVTAEESLADMSAGSATGSYRGIPALRPIPAPHRVLVVDDSLETLEILQRNLTAAGYQVLTATSALEAIRLLERSAVDLVVTDLKMPASADSIWCGTSGRTCAGRR